METMQYLTLDPGVTVGWACWRPELNRYSCGQIPHDRVWYMLEQARCTYELEGPVVFESFQYRQNLPKADLTPVEVIGVVKEWARQHKWRLISQTPAERMFFTDDVLRNAGLWRPGKPHAMDALRHLLYFRQAFTIVRDLNKERREKYEESNRG